MRRLITGLIYIIILAVLAVTVYFSFQRPNTQTSDANGQSASSSRRQQRGKSDDTPISVLVAPVKKQDVPVYIDAVGNVKAFNSVAVRPQVAGQLVAVLFQEGQDVKKNQIIAQIDPTIYRAAYHQAQAKRTQDEALHENALRDLERYKRLAQTNAGTAQQADTQQALVEQLEAQLSADTAAIETARAQLDYTNIAAPLDGRTGIRAIDEGNIVATNDSSPIVTISQIQPISVQFSVPQQQLAELVTAKSNGSLEVDVVNSDDNKKIDEGVLEVIDNQIDPTTGTVKAKATMPNPDLRLWPGAFINVKVLVRTLHQALTIPASAVQHGQQTTFVYLEKDGHAFVKPVTVLLQDEAKAVIAQGLDETDQIIVSGLAQLSDGSKVTIAEPNVSTDQDKKHPKTPKDTSSQASPVVPSQPDNPGGEKAQKRRHKENSNAEGNDSSPSNPTQPNPTQPKPTPSVPAK